MSKDEYLITDAPLKALTVFAMPMILGSFFQQVYNMADSIIVGQFVGSSASGFYKKILSDQMTAVRTDRYTAVLSARSKPAKRIPQIYRVWS